MADKDYLATRLFTDRDCAEREYQATLARGYDPEDINVVMTEEGSDWARRVNTPTPAP
jgi:hypothetical protein